MEEAKVEVAAHRRATQARRGPCDIGQDRAGKIMNSEERDRHVAYKQCAVFRDMDMMWITEAEGRDWQPAKEAEIHGPPKGVY